MSTETYDRIAWNPTTEEEKAAVRQQLHRLLQTTHFRNSKRYPALFRFIVEEALEGRGEFLKERLLGIRVFDRPADYDTATDPIVRVTVAEIRKRIAQYYHEEAHESEMRIELLPGSYEPEFRPRQDSLRSHVVPLPDLPTAPSLPEVQAASVIRSSRSARGAGLLWLGAAVGVAVVAGFFGWRWMHPSATEEFWAPLLAGHRAITFCVPRAGGEAAITAKSEVVGGQLVNQLSPMKAGGHISPDPNFLEHESLGENVVFSDMAAAMRVSDLLAGKGSENHLRMSVATSLDDLRQGPAVLVGGMDNQWTMHAINPLRFRFAGSDDESYWIADATNPAAKDWSLDLKKPLLTVTRDYAIVARIHDSSTGELEVIVAGIGMSGTAAAGEFLADPQQLEELRRRVGPGFRNRDFEAVLSTDVVNGMSGSPRILTVAVW
ncbi:hypothetical protein [Granulicella paludicola]|uniref:hypothetical protein n=1 Tax=Granulicella paludicola TaxID=474951 RepID=UPI0021E0E155|nr:hypothetical protein [Granulicella paludicola]